MMTTAFNVNANSKKAFWKSGITPDMVKILVRFKFITKPC